MSQMTNVSDLQTDFKLKQSRDGFLNPGSRQNSSMSQITNVSELQDIAPTAWAYEALRGLVERYGCIVGYPDRTFRGDRALSRHEFAAGLNACLNTIERLIQENVAVLREDIEKLKRLAKEFEGELIALGARVGNLEQRVAFIEEHQFATTTKLTGEMVVGLTGVADGDMNGGEDVPRTTNLGYRARLELNTSFDGSDLLYTRLATGTVPTYSTITGTFQGDLGFSQPDDSNLAVEVLYYEFDLAENVRVWVEPFGGAFDDYTNTVNYLDGDGAGGALSAFGTRNPIYYIAEGQGIGFQGTVFEVFEWSAGYLANNGNNPDLGDGLFNGAFAALGQIGYKPSDDFMVAFTYLHGYNTVDTGTGSRRSNFQAFIEEEFEQKINTINDSYGMEFSWRIAPKFVFGGWVAVTKAKTQNVILSPNNLLDQELAANDAADKAATQGAAQAVFQAANQAAAQAADEAAAAQAQADEAAAAQADEEFAEAAAVAQAAAQEAAQAAAEAAAQAADEANAAADAAAEAANEADAAAQAVAEQNAQIAGLERKNLDIWNWGLTFAFPDAFSEGDTAAIIIGMQPWVSQSNIVLPDGARNNDRDSSYHIEAFYEYKVNDNMKLTPGIIIITSPDYDDDNNTLVIGTVRATFTF
ncbi:iron uptake porin [Aphanothece sacrum]